MNSILSLLILLPLLEILASTFARKYKMIHEILLCLISITGLVFSILLPISKTIYSIDFGFVSLKFMCDIYSYIFGILVSIVWILTNLYSYSYASLSIHRHKVNQFIKLISFLKICHLQFSRYLEFVILPVW